MGPPLIFIERDWRYKLGTGFLLLGTVLSIFGIISPGWYDIAETRTGNSGYSHLWIVCTDGLQHCGVLGSSSFTGFEKATQALVLIGLLSLLTACLLGVFLNFVTHNRAHNRWLEILAFVGGGLIFLGAIVFVGAGSDYASDDNHTRLPPMDRYSLSFGYALVLTFLSAILVIAAGVLIFIFNRPLIAPSDVRSLSALRSDDPVDRLHDDVDDSEGGFRTAQLRVPSSSRPPPDYESQVAAQPRFRFPSRDGGHEQVHGRSVNGYDSDEASGDLGIPSQNFVVGRSNRAYVPDPSDKQDRVQSAFRPVSGTPPHYSDYDDYEVLRKEPYMNGTVNPYTALTERQRSVDQDDSSNYAYTTTDRGRRHQAPPSRQGTQPCHISDGRRDDRNGYANLTSGYRPEPRHANEQGEDDRNDSAGFTSRYRDQPRHFREEGHADRDDDVNYTSGYNQRPRHYSDGGDRGRDADVFMISGQGEDPHHYGHIGQSRVRAGDTDRRGEYGERHPVYYNEPGHTRESENVSDTSSGLEIRAYGAARPNRCSDDDFDSDIDIPVGVPPPAYTSTQV